MGKWIDGPGHSPEPALWIPSHLSEQSGPQEATKPAPRFAGTTTGLSERRVPVPWPPGFCAALGGPLGTENQVNTQEEEGARPSAHLSALSIRSGGFSREAGTDKTSRRKTRSWYRRPRGKVSAPHSPGTRPGCEVSFYEC